MRSIRSLIVFCYRWSGRCDLKLILDCNNLFKLILNELYLPAAEGGGDDETFQDKRVFNLLLKNNIIRNLEEQWDFP
jgi:hypothetical protein